MTSAADLFGLQEIDLSRDNRRALIADINSRLGESEELIGAREEVKTAEAELEALRRDQRELDSRVQDLDAKIGPLDQKLYGGSIRNPRELTDLQHEVELLKNQRRKLDDDGLILLEAVDTATRRLDTATERLTMLEAEWRADLVDLHATRERAEQELERLNAERKLRTAGMEASALGVYDALRPKKQGHAVARIERGTCQGCRLLLPSYVVQKARSAVALVQCPSCERILVGG